MILSAPPIRRRNTASGDAHCLRGTNPPRMPGHGVIMPASVSTVWDFIVTVPAIGLKEYAAIVPVPYVPSPIPPWYVFIVVAQTAGMQVYTSMPDSILDPAPLTDVTGGTSGQIPSDLVLRQNFPNPFNPSTTITYGLPRRDHVSLIVYNALGQIIKTLVDQDEDAGYHAARFDGSEPLPPGLYFYRLSAGGLVRTFRSISSDKDPPTGRPSLFSTYGLPRARYYLDNSQ